MSAETAVQWVIKLHENEELRKEAEAAGSFEARQELAKKHGFKFTKEEIEKALKGDESELSDDDLDAVSGGTDATTVLNSTVSGMRTASSIAVGAGAAVAAL